MSITTKKSRALLAAASLYALGGAISMVHAGNGQAKNHDSIAWTTSFSTAKATAARVHKPLLVDFYAPWCGPCEMMLHTTYQDKRVVRASKNFVPVLVDADKQPTLAGTYGIEAIPTLAFMDASGKVLSESTGYLDADDFLSMAKSVPLSSGQGERKSK